jgi:hypothetical protein
MPNYMAFKVISSYYRNFIYQFCINTWQPVKYICFFDMGYVPTTNID